MTTARPRLDNAACRGREDLYLNEKPKTGDIDLMRKICATCWDRPECLAWALEREPRGFWAGHSPSSRRRLREQYGIELQPFTDRGWVSVRRAVEGDDDDGLDDAGAVAAFD